jgi:tetratricopeptide (TPR) repeat protein
MANGSVFDVVLLGYRNDIAQARTLEFLDQLPLAFGPPQVDRVTGLPQRLFTALDNERAQRLRAALEACGAQVALLEVGGTETPPPLTLPPISIAPPEVRSHAPRPSTLFLVAALAAAVYLWRGGQLLPRQPPLPPRATVPAVPLAASIANMQDADTVQLNADAAALAASRDFPDAVERLQEALQRAPGDAVLTRNLQTVLLNWGIANLAAQRLDDAAERLEAAARLGERAEVLSALGITRLRQSDYPAAATALERALQLTPKDPNTLLALAEVYLKQDKRPQALDLLQRAKESGVRSPELDNKVAQLGREVDAEWDFVQTESAHFRVSFADTEDGHAVRLVLAALEEAYFTVGSKFEDYPAERTPVVLYTQQDFHNITQTPGWAGAAFDGRIKLPVRGLQAEDTQLPRVIRHEYAHSLITQLSNNRVPVWLNEGLAVWAEETEEGERQAWAEQKIAGQELFTLAQLSGSFIQLPAARAEVAYAQSYLAVRQLIDEYGARKIPALLSNLAHSRNMSEAFAATYPGDLAGFEDRLLQRLTG